MTQQQRQRWILGKRKFTPGIEQFKEIETRIMAEIAAEHEQREKLRATMAAEEASE